MRLVARGDQQDPSLLDVYAGVVRYSTVRTVCALATILGWECTCMDVCTAFLQAPLTGSPTYMEQPDGFKTFGPNGEKMLFRLRQAIYGLRQSQSEWGAVLRDWLQCEEKEGVSKYPNTTIRFVRSGADAQMYVHMSSRGTLIILVYVDDLIIFSSSRTLRDEFAKAISLRFKMKDLGRAVKALGMDFTQSADHRKLRLSLKSYLEGVNERFAICDAERADTPITRRLCSECTNAHPTNSEVQECVEMYTKATGVMIFAASSCRAECAYTAHFMSRFMHRPGPVHLRMARRALGYLIATKELGLEYNGSRSSSGSITNQASPEGDPEYQHVRRPIGAADSNHDIGPSLTAYVFKLADAAINWMCRLQKVASISSSESEFYSLSSCVSMSIHIENILQEMGYNMDGPMEILCDSRGARMLAVHARSTPRTRHIHRRWFFVTYYAAAKRIAINEVSSEDNWSNILTKPLGLKTFCEDRDRLGVKKTW